MLSNADIATMHEHFHLYKKQGLKLDMSRGKPSKEQLDLTAQLFQDVPLFRARINRDGVDTGNYGILDGISEMKEIFSQLLEVPPENILVGGNSSLNLMFDLLSQHLLVGNQDSPAPWGIGKDVKILCPVPGYDRHFAMCAFLGIRMIPIEMTPEGPDMDQVELMVSSDPSVKGMWLVPLYSNPDGYSCSDDTIRRLAAMKTCAPDFRIFCDHAYIVHHLYEQDRDSTLNLITECMEQGNPDRPYVFTSTSKISFPGSGVSALASSRANILNILHRLQYQTIGYNKLNMLLHARALESRNKIEHHMSRLAEIMRPKFEIVHQVLKQELGQSSLCRWNRPKGGYFISFYTMEGCGKRTVHLCKALGVMITPAGVTYPHGKDPRDSNIRIAPTFLSKEELTLAMKVFCLCVHIAQAEKETGKEWV